jgi:isopenicillin N synthase-like dioxygenase
VKLVRYEDLVAALKDLDGDSGERFFAELFDYCGIERPDDWRERVRIGSDRKQSGTARENLTGVGIEFPDELPALQKQMIDFAAPGLRALLGYQ